MCGIAVYAALEGSSQDKGLVENSLKQLHHRGPDGSAVLGIPQEELAGPSIILGHTRLAVVGNGSATQPLKCARGDFRFYLVHNGEVYNYENLRKQLIIEGVCKTHDFKTEGDSEVLLLALAHMGIQWALDNVTGQFAFVFVQCRLTEVGEEVNDIFLCRDAFGIKPLCYAFDRRRQKLFICSEFQALPQNLGLKDIQDVLPSSFIKISFQRKNKCCNWSVREHKYETIGGNTSSTKSFLHSDLLLDIQSQLIKAVSLRIPADVRFAVLLSGGVDSSLICRLAADMIFPKLLYTFTITTSKGVDAPLRSDSDCHFARLVAEEAPNIIHEEVHFDFEDGVRSLPHVVKCVETTDTAIVRAGVPLYLLSKHISAQGFKVLLCGEGADESMAGYRLFESFKDDDSFLHELNRRLKNIDTSELQRVDRCTSAHGLEARVPFMDTSFIKVVMEISTKEKMTHPSLGRIQKYILRKAFDGKYHQSKVTGKQLLPDSVLYREKEQFADGVGRSWITRLQEYARELFPGLTGEEAECALYRHYQQPGHPGLDELIQTRNSRRRQDTRAGKPGRSQPARFYPIRSDPDLAELNLTVADANHFLKKVLGWSDTNANCFSPSLQSLNMVIVSMLERVPFHNLTLLTRERRPPTMAEIKEDMMSGIGGPCAVVNAFFAVLLERLGFGPHIYLLSCEINGRRDCHVAILLQFKGLRYFVDVANAKPYNHAVHLGDSSTFTCLDGSFLWGLRYNEETALMEVHHSNEKALSFHPACTVPYSSFRDMIISSRSVNSFGPFLTGLRFVVYPDRASNILAVRDACIFDGSSTQEKLCAGTKETIQTIANRPPFSFIQGFKELVDGAIVVLDRENPGWFERSREVLLERGVSECRENEVL